MKMNKTELRRFSEFYLSLAVMYEQTSHIIAAIFFSLAEMYEQKSLTAPRRIRKSFVMSEYQKQRIADGKKAKGQQIISDEQKKKISASLRGRLQETTHKNNLAEKTRKRVKDKSHNFINAGKVPVFDTKTKTMVWLSCDEYRKDKGRYFTTSSKVYQTWKRQQQKEVMI